MSYLHRLDQARTLLGEGRLLAAEHELREATAEWKRSRVRAPLVEKGIEPALRTLGRVFGRKSEEPVLPVFSRGAELLREDLYAFAKSLATELLEEIESGGGDSRLRHERATEALELQRSSEFFSILPAREWGVVRVWLNDARALGRGIRAELLPAGDPPAEDRQWWLEWLEEWCRYPVEPVRAFAEWARGVTVRYGGVVTEDLEEPARWAWVQARLALLDPLAAPRAMAAVERVLEYSDDSTLRREALQAWAELVTNLRVFAMPGGNARDLLEERSMDAARLGMPWPPVEVAQGIAERRPGGASPCFVSVRWHDDATAIAFVLHEGRRAADVLCLKPSAEPRPEDPFAMDETRAQRRIAAWMPPGAILLSAREPGPRLRSLVGSARWIPVEQLLELFGCAAPDLSPSVAPTVHPAWNREICAPWDGLVPAARRLLPALDSLFEAWPSFVSLWGRENLQRIGTHGLPLAEALADAAELVRAPAASAGLVETAAPLSLVWPSLAARPWPVAGGGDSAVRPPQIAGAGRVWIDRRATAMELALTAASGGASSLLCVGSERALELADASARVCDRVGVSLVTEPPPCLRPLLDLLNRWLTESPGDLERGRAAVWLLAVLSEQAGSLEPLLARSGDEALVAEVREHMRVCTGECGSHRDTDCWPEQAGARIAASHVAVVDLAGPSTSPPGRRTVADDLRGWVTGVTDDEALRRLRTIPVGPEPVVVFTPGVAFIPGLLGVIPGPDGGDGEWFFEGSVAQPQVAVWSVPRGYGSNVKLLAREARGLLEERARRWLADVGEAPLWGEDLEDLAAALQGVADEPSAETVLVTSLGEGASPSALLAGLRLAAAASHARARVVCLTPVFAELFEVSGGLAFGEDDTAVPRALDSGSALLAARRGRVPATWTSPLTRPRLESVGAGHPRELSDALGRWTAGRARVLAGATEADRDAVVDTIRQLQLEALDGGPLGVRSIVLVCAAARAENGPAEARLRSLERGRRSVVHLEPDELGDPAVLDWGRRNAATVWVFRNAELVLDDPVRAATGRLLAALRRSQARAVFFTDHEDVAREVRTLVAAHLPVEAVATIASIEGGLDASPFEVRTLGALEVSCPQCNRSVLYQAAFELCPECGIPVDSVASVRRALRIAFEGRVVDALRQLGPQAGFTLVVFDAARCSRLRQRLGVGPRNPGETPLLDAMDLHLTAEVITPEALWDRAGFVGPLIVCGLPDSLRSWRELAGRMHALEMAPGPWWLAPPGLDESEDLPSAEPGFEISRDEFLTRLGEPEGKTVATRTLKRLEAAGGSFGRETVLRVHELVTGPQSDDAPLAALAHAARAGWVRPEGVGALPQPTPAVFERTVRSRGRLRLPPAEGSEEHQVVAGRVVGIGGFGKTTALLSRARSARAEGASVLVLVPAAVARLEWVERAADPSVACLDFDEFLLEFVAGVQQTGPGRRLRVLPGAEGRWGEEVRLELVRTVSELYAEGRGELPGVDSRSIIRALEGERLGVDPYSRDAGVDFEFLARCIDQARREGGWTDTRELLARSKAVCASHSGRVRSWVEQFDEVIVDDAHDLPVGGAEFIRELFGPRLGAWSHDPVLAPLPDGEVRDEAMHSERFGPAIAEAIERVWRTTTPLPARLKGRRNLRSSVESERILALSAAVERIADELEQDGAGPDVAIVAAAERDRRLMEQQLSVRGIAVAGLDRDFDDLVSGPREVLAALAWVAGPASRDSSDLLAVVLAGGPDPALRDDAAHYEKRLRRRLDGETVEVLDRAEAFLLPLVLVRSALGPTTRFEQAVDVLLGCGLLEGLRRQPGVATRIEGLVRQYRGLSLAEVMAIIPTASILAPSTGGTELRLLAPDQLAGRSFDVIHYICTGFEPPERHYRVLSRARRSVKIACSEVDPLQG